MSFSNDPWSVYTSGLTRTLSGARVAPGSGIYNSVRNSLISARNAAIQGGGAFAPLGGMTDDFIDWFAQNRASSGVNMQEILNAWNNWNQGK